MTFRPTRTYTLQKVARERGTDVEDERFDSAWSAYGPAVLRYCTYSTGSSDAGEDVAAETFARFLARGDRVPVEHTEAWLIRVARNLCVTYHRNAKRRDAVEARLGSVYAERADGWQGLGTWEYVRRLSEASRLVIYLRVAEDRPFAEIARLTGRSESAAKMTFYRAIERLREQMASDDASVDDMIIGGVGSVPAE